MIRPNTDKLMQLMLEYPSLPNLFNPIRDFDPQNDAEPSAPLVRYEQLKSYLDIRIGVAKVILMAEAASYRGAKYTGIAMMDEKLLLGLKKTAPFGPNSIIDIPPKATSQYAASKPKRAVTEGTCTSLYKFLYEAGVDPRTIVTWNTLPFHPHKPTNSLSNRPPTEFEKLSAMPIHQEFFRIFEGCRIISIGNHAENLMEKLGRPFEKVRHPAYGGASIFTDFLRKALV